MSLITDIVFGGGQKAGDEDFDKNEAGDLAFHVRQCTRRYREMDTKLNLAIRLILVLCLLYMINNAAAVKAMLF